MIWISEIFSEKIYKQYVEAMTKHIPVIILIFISLLLTVFLTWFYNTIL